MLTPYAVCTDGQDRLFVADTNAQTVHVFDLRTRRYEQWKPAEGGAAGFAAGRYRMGLQFEATVCRGFGRRPDLRVRFLR